MKNHFRLLLKCFALTLALLLGFWVLERADDTPKIEKGKSAVVYTAEKHAQNTAVYKVTATRDYLFLNHGQDGIVSVYDRAGHYCFSIVTTWQGNGLPEVYCVGGLLYLIDKNSHVFVYDGTRLAEEYQISSLEQGSELRSRLKQENSNLVSFDGVHVCDADGKTLLTVSKSSDQALKRRVLLLLPVFLLLCLIIFRKELASKKRNNMA